MNKNAIGLHKFSRIFRRGILQYLPHIPCRLQQIDKDRQPTPKCFASIRSVQIATVAGAIEASITPLCLHTLRADCNRRFCSLSGVKTSLPPHAPCRLQQDLSVAGKRAGIHLCLRTLRADCNHAVVRKQFQHIALPPHAPCRLQRQKCTELQYTLFRTRVESVDSFSVLNKSMLR
jgi:hypothetical protein